eukprot:scaffold94854_cov41-Prasinocladus_malaysianus.AAC.1
MGARWGIRATLLTGLTLQVLGIAMLMGWQDVWALPENRGKGMVYVTFAQMWAGIAKMGPRGLRDGKMAIHNCIPDSLIIRPAAKLPLLSNFHKYKFTAIHVYYTISNDLTKLGGKTVTKLVTPDEKQTKLFKLVSFITGFKNTLKVAGPNPLLAFLRWQVVQRLTTGFGYFLGSALVAV